MTSRSTRLGVYAAGNSNSWMTTWIAPPITPMSHRYSFSARNARSSSRSRFPEPPSGIVSSGVEAALDGVEMVAFVKLDLGRVIGDELVIALAVHLAV